MKPYITAEIKAMIAERNRIQRKYAKRPITYGDAYRSIRNRVTQAIRTAKSNYYRRELERHSNNLKKYWKVINDILNRGKRIISVNSEFEIDSTLTNDSKEIANGFNRYFVQIGETLARQCPAQGTDFHSYLRNRLLNDFQFPQVTESVLLNVIRE